MKTNPNFNQRKTYNYRKLLPPKIYWTGVVVSLIQWILLVWISFFEGEERWGFLSGMSALICYLVMKADRGENPLVEKWKSEVFGIVMCLLAFQLMLVMLGSIFNG